MIINLQVRSQKFSLAVTTLLSHTTETKIVELLQTYMMINST